jgi:hypothetical protein
MGACIVRKKVSYIRQLRCRRLLGQLYCRTLSLYKHIHAADFSSRMSGLLYHVRLGLWGIYWANIPEEKLPKLRIDQKAWLVARVGDLMAGTGMLLAGVGLVRHCG